MQILPPQRRCRWRLGECRATGTLSLSASSGKSAASACIGHRARRKKLITTAPDDVASLHSLGHVLLIDFHGDFLTWKRHREGWADAVGDEGSGNSSSLLCVFAESQYSKNVFDAPEQVRDVPVARHLVHGVDLCGELFDFLVPVSAYLGISFSSLGPHVRVDFDGELSTLDLHGG